MANFDSIRFQQGRPLLRELSADRLNSIIAEIKKTRVKGERGITVRQTGNGFYVGLAKNVGDNSQANAQHPFQILTKSDADTPNTLLLSVRPGTINGVIPSNWDIEESIADDVTKYVVLTASATANQITSALLSVEDTAPTGEVQPVKWGLAEEFEVLLGLVVSGEVYQIINNSLNYTARKRITTDRDNPQLGQLPYDNWYVWEKLS